MSTPHYDGKFNVYDDIKQKLIAKGVPEKEIAFIHDAKTDLQKKALFAKVRKGQVRVLLGSTPMMGSGTNIQDKLIAMHDLDAPWRPSDLAQRAGRIVRQGNENKEVNIYRYVTEKTFDSYLYQTLETKQKFIAQIMTSKAPARVCEDLDEVALSFAEIKALCAGNPLIMEKFELEQDVHKLRLLQSDHQSQHYRLEDSLLRHYPETIKAAENRIRRYTADIKTVADNTHPNDKGFSPMKIGKTVYDDKEQAGKALIAACRKIPRPEKGQNVSGPFAVGNYRGLDMNLSYDAHWSSFTLTLKGAMSYAVMLGEDVYGNITRINNELDGIPGLIEEAKTVIANTEKQIENAKAELARPFPQEQELTMKAARLAEVDALLNLDKPDHSDMLDDENTSAAAQPINQMLPETERIAAKREAVAKRPPSIIDQLKRPAIPGADAQKGKLAEVCM